MEHSKIYGYVTNNTISFVSNKVLDDSIGGMMTRIAVIGMMITTLNLRMPIIMFMVLTILVMTTVISMKKATITTLISMKGSNHVVTSNTLNDDAQNGDNVDDDDTNCGPGGGCHSHSVSVTNKCEGANDKPVEI